MKKIAIPGLLLFLFAFCSCHQGNEKNKTIKLELKFPAGSSYLYSMDTRQTLQQQMGAMNSEISQHMQLQTSYQVSDGGNGNKKLTIAYDRFYIKSASNGMTMEYDSDDSSKQPDELKSIGSLVHHPFSIVVNTKGNILKVETNTPVSSVAQDQFSDSSIRQMMEQSLNIYPDKPVKPGDSWQRTYATSIGFMDMQVNSNYKLISVSHDIAHIEIKATIKSFATDNQGIQDMRLEMDGTQTGAMDIDVKTGLIQDSHFTQNVKGKMHIPGAVIPMDLTSDTRIIGKMK